MLQILITSTVNSEFYVDDWEMELKAAGKDLQILPMNTVSLSGYPYSYLDTRTTGTLSLPVSTEDEKLELTAIIRYSVNGRNYTKISEPTMFSFFATFYSMKTGSFPFPFVDKIDCFQRLFLILHIIQELKVIISLTYIVSLISHCRSH